MDLTENKPCTKCNQELPATAEYFYSDKSKKSGLRSQCKECLKEYQKQYKKENRDRILEYSKKYNRENRDWYSEYQKNYYRQYRKENKDWILERQKQYRKENKDKEAARTAKRRAAKLQRTPPWLTDEHFQQIRHIYQMKNILIEIDAAERHVDHIVPLQGENVSGLHVPWNLQILPAKENLSKTNKSGEINDTTIFKTYKIHRQSISPF